jgi:hypothetical protein
VLTDLPLVFFGVVLGVALIFRLGVGLARETVATAGPIPTATSREVTRGAELQADPRAGGPLPDRPEAAAGAAADVGGTARVQAARALPTLPGAPVRIPPRPRGHGHRPSPRER